MVPPSAFACAPGACGPARSPRRPEVRQPVAAENSAKPNGPYRPVIRGGKLLFLSGQVGFDPATGNLVADDIESQTDQVMRNIASLLQAAGVDYRSVVRTTVFLADMNEFSAMNTIYARYVVDPPP